MNGGRIYEHITVKFDHSNFRLLRERPTRHHTVFGMLFDPVDAHCIFLRVFFLPHANQMFMSDFFFRYASIVKVEPASRPNFTKV